MLFQTLHSGIPGTLTHQQQQDDLLHNIAGDGGDDSRELEPELHLPRVCAADQVLGAARRGDVRLSHGLGCNGATRSIGRASFCTWSGSRRTASRRRSVRAWIRADNGGRDMPSLTFEPETWITMGISHTPDGAVHFFLRPGIDDLTKEDCVGSYWCYGYRAHTFQTFFFNVINMDDGRSVSTPWIVDDALSVCGHRADEQDSHGGRRQPDAGKTSKPRSRVRHRRRDEQKEQRQRSGSQRGISVLESLSAFCSIVRRPMYERLSMRGFANPVNASESARAVRSCRSAAPCCCEDQLLRTVAQVVGESGIGEAAADEGFELGLVADDDGGFVRRETA